MFDVQTGKYLCRRQYVLGPRRVDGLGNWNQIQIAEKYFLNTHQELPVIEVRFKERSIYLLGYIIDPHNPEHTDAAVMESVIQRSKTAEDVFLNISDKCGRFVIIVRMGDDFRIFSDPCGLRQIFYHVDKSNSIWCASQPHLIAGELEIEVNEVRERDLHKSSLFKTEEHWYPGYITLFDNIFHLTPNHYLDFPSGSVVRYWPLERLSPISISDCIPVVSSLLTGIIEGAVHRYNIAFAISSGLDSRTLFAASRKVAKNIHYFTQGMQSSVGNDPDVVIPSAMLKQLGLEHSVLVLPEKLDSGFEAILKKNVFTARTTKGLNAISIFDHFKDDQKELVVMYGNCSEITKRDRFRFPKTPKPLLSGTTLAAMAQMSRSDVAIEQFREWVAPVKKLTRHNIDILDLMHWEQRVGNWGAMTLSEYDIVYESLCPYSCRKYIEYMLRVPFKFRTKPDYKLHHDIIAALWPEALTYEINPEKNRMKKTVEDFLYQTDLYDPIKLLYLMLYKRFK